ncbi:DegT/DnrJ/EryC1/StrS family aminotransferase [Nonomuraea gerenzanensis]|uniref:UDP-4-amino-4-deoxy-L-arabinose--oxoglutarate aminotransferase n=1 Tax=Nonomuraea gerenzanensis TaxID=93944 RepID=A0A1M4EA08_9ACTN|nr:DegT/DnrJ/EryC1/StrS family aminotransferase [Nonomuraea gerenzanensis]UBU17819.1 DegT/DnrJ/EryC1/StrS family aminotransferase [Nonomuraea gerenzanensis]SBO95602.1 UDP-4-amino-4-deoxy-L-arabinose--oxoglutarate aminotransferase [Nonomuraea gerenzanensis]
MTSGPASAPPSRKSSAWDLRAFRALADERGLLLIEDAAHALRACRDGLRAGAVGDLAAFSFYANKVVTTGEGGMLLGRGDLLHRARLLGRHGIDSSVWRRHSGRRTVDYEVTMPGLKYVMSDLAAAIGLAQWRKLSAFTERRAKIAALYTVAFAGLPGLATPAVLPGVEPGWFLYSVFIDPAHAPLTRDATAERLLAEHKIATSQHFHPVHTLQAYSGSARCPLPVTETVAARQLSLPCYPAMSDDQVRQVITDVRGCSRVWLTWVSGRP